MPNGNMDTQDSIKNSGAIPFSQVSNLNSLLERTKETKPFLKCPSKKRMPTKFIAFLNGRVFKTLRVEFVKTNLKKANTPACQTPK
jgi:hypothetical protein